MSVVIFSPEMSSTSTNISLWPLLNKMKSEYSMLTKFKYWDTKIFGITQDQRLLLIEGKSSVITELEDFRGKLIKDIACGLKFFNVLTVDGELHLISELDYDLSYRSIGGPGDKPRHRRTQVALDLVEQVQCSDHYSIALTSYGHCYYWGLTLCNNSSMYLIPNEIYLPYGVTAKQVVCGGCCFMVLTSDNRVYGYGSNSGKQLGKDLPSMVAQAVKLKLDKDIKSIGFSGETSLFLTFEGILFHAGRTTEGEFKPVETNVTFENVFGTRCGVIVGKSTNGKIYAWGRTKQGKLETPIATELSFLESISAYFQELHTPILIRMYQVFTQPVLGDKITEMLNKESDIEFVFPNENKTIKAHKFMLNLDSEYMRTQISEKWCQSNQVCIKQYSFIEYYHYIYFLYTREIKTNTMGEAFDLLRLSSCFLEKSLEIACCEHILNKYFNTETCVAIYECFVENSMNKYEAQMVMYIADNLADLYKQPKFHNMSQELFKRFNLQYSKILFNKSMKSSR